MSFLLYFDIVLLLVERGDSVDVLYALDQLSDVITSDRLDRGALLDLTAMAHRPGVANNTGMLGVLIVFAFHLDVLVNIDASVHEILLRKHGLEDGLTVGYINSM